VAAVGALALGFLIAREFPFAHASMWFAVCQALLVIVLLTSGRTCRVLLFVAAAAFAGGWFSLRIHESRERIVTSIFAPLGLERDGTGAAERALVQATGIVLEPPQLTEGPRGKLARYFHSSPSVRFTMAARRLVGPEGVVEAGGTIVVFVSLPDTAPFSSLGARAGDTVQVTGQFSMPQPPMNPGETDKRLYAAQDGVIGRLHVPDPSLVESVNRSDAPSSPIGVAVSVFARVQAAMRSRAREALAAALPIEHDRRAAARDSSGRALLIAMLLGEREVGYDEADEAFRRLGLVHLVAISGFNLAILAGLVLFVIRLTGSRGRVEPLVVAAIVTAYMIVVPAEAPVLRSGITVLCFLAAEASGRRYDRLGMLGWVAVLLLLWRPMDLWSLGFQLSFGIVAALLWLGRFAEARLFGVPLRGVINPPRAGLFGRVSIVREATMSVLRPLVSSSLLAWSVAVPTIAVHTGNFSPFAALTGIIVLPLSIMVLWAGYLALAVGVLIPGIGAWTGGVLRRLGDLLVGAVFRFDDLPGMAVSLPRLSVWWGACATVSILLWFRLGLTRHKQLRRGLFAATLVLVLWLAVEMFQNTRLGSGSILRIDTLAVGDGTCHLVRSGDDAMLWDCGSSMSGFGVRSLPRAARDLGAWRVRTVVLTHANLDHFSALLDAAEVLGVRQVLICEAFKTDAEAHPRGADAALIQALTGRGIEVRVIAAGERMTFGSADLRFLSPLAGAVFPESNDSSLVGLFTAPTDEGERYAIFMGDAGVAAIQGVRNRHPTLHADILELPHHGSFNHESLALVAALNPSVVMQSTGPKRVGDSRWDTVRDGRHWHITATEGALWAEVRRDGTIRHGSMADR